MRRYNHLWEQIISPHNLEVALYKAIKKAKRKKRSMRAINRVIKNPAYYLDRLADFMQDYHTSRYHNKFKFVPKLRVIYSLPFYPDRIAHHAIMNIVAPLWDGMMYYHSYSCRDNKGQHKASYKCREYVRKYKYCAQLDVSQFYPNLDHELLKDCYRRKIKDRRLLAVLDEIVDSVDARKNNIRLYRELLDSGVSLEQASVGMNKLLKAEAENNHRPAGVAVGNLVSQWYGNLFLTDIDHSIRTPFIRFCDDMLIFSNDKQELKDVAAAIAEKLKARRLSLSHIKIIPTAQGVDFCGYKSFPEFTLVRKSTARRKINEARQLHTMSYTHARGVLAAMNGILKHANSYNLRLKLHYEAVS